MDSRVDKTIILFEYFYQVVSGNKVFEFEPKERDMKMIKNFIKSLSVSHDSNWLYDYFAFQFQRYNTMKTRFGKGKVMLGWIIGPKSLKYYRECSEEEKYWGEQFKLDKDLKNPLVERSKVDLFSHLDKERLRWYGTDRGLIHCKDMNLADHKSKYCKMCKNNRYCI